MARRRRFDWLFRPQLADEDLPLSAEARFPEALADLPAVERSALALSEIGGLDTEEIAERLGTDPAVVEKLLVRARRSVRTSLALGSRRGLGALIPFQNWWQSGSSAPAVRAAGAVAAAVVGTGVAIGGASADPPRPVLTSPDPPVARSLDAPLTRPTSPPPANVVLAAVEIAGTKTRVTPRWAAKPAPPAPPSAHAPHTLGDEPDLAARPVPAAPVEVTPTPTPEPVAPAPVAPVSTVTTVARIAPVPSVLPVTPVTPVTPDLPQLPALPATPPLPLP